MGVPEIPGTAQKLHYLWKAFFMWFKLSFIHAFVAIFPVFAPLNTLLIIYFNKNEVAQTKSIDSWTFLLNCIFQTLCILAAIAIFPVGVYLFEAVKARVDGVYTEPTAVDRTPRYTYTPDLG